jgi:hypothetical protein
MRFALSSSHQLCLSQMTAAVLTVGLRAALAVMTSALGSEE